METTIVYWGSVGKMENYWGLVVWNKGISCIGIMIYIDYIALVPTNSHDSETFRFVSMIGFCGCGGHVRAVRRVYILVSGICFRVASGWRVL